MSLCENVGDRMRDCQSRLELIDRAISAEMNPVSYTHLTLPTILRV